MPALHGNYIDLLVLIFLGVYAWEGIRRGFLGQVAEMGSFILAFILGLRLYPQAARLLMDNFSFSLAFANAIGFITVAIGTEIILSRGLVFIIRRVPKLWLLSPINRISGILPAIIDGLILVAFFLTAIITLPVSGKIKNDIVVSRVGKEIVERTTSLEKSLSQIFGGAVEETLNFLTVQPGSTEKVDLHFTTTGYSVDPQIEEGMVKLVNQERIGRGIKTLEVDNRLREIARTHSADMFKRGYFSHVDPDGNDPFARMQKAGIAFILAGENLAYAPSLAFAHNGLMNSPGHRANILNQDFGKIGIGVVDGGIYGKMFTQEFTD